MSTDPQAGYDPLGLAAVTDAQVGAPLRLRMASPMIGDEEKSAVVEALGSGMLTNGPQTRLFEQAMAERQGTEHAVAMSNGTVALAAMLLASGIGPGDEVIVPSLTFIATATAVLHVGATPVFADVEADTFTLSVTDTERRITPRTRAVIPVHYGGQVADMVGFRDLASAHRLCLLEDAAQAHGALLNGRPAGSWGDAGMFSFTPMKLITTGEGAVVTTDDGDLAYQMRLLRNHGMDRQYHHEVLGWNWRITEMQAAMGVHQVARLDHILEVKQTNARRFAELLEPVAPVAVPVNSPGRLHPYTLYTLTMEPAHRHAVADALEAAGIETRFYFPPVHLQPVFATDAGPGPDLPVTEHLAERILSVPFHARVTDDDLTEMARIIEGATS